jgi:Bacterial PH domain
MDFFTGKEIEAPEDVKRLLQFNEKILLSAETARSASLINPETIFVTSQRVIVRRPTTLGLRKNIEDYRFTDIANVHLKKGIIRSGVILKMRFLSDNVEVDNFPKEVGEKIFRLVQDGVAGRLSLAQPQDNVVKTPNIMQQEIIEKIKELAKLKDQGILSDIEFQSKKSELLARL